ncbi:S-layer homology domain-containing protein, partial [Spirulina subsalsa FACHB-351]
MLRLLLPLLSFCRRRGTFFLLAALTCFLTLLPLGGLAQRTPTLPRDIQGHWAQQCLAHIVEQGVMKPFADRTFRPNVPMTRGEFATVINRAFPDANPVRIFQPDRFIDIPDGYWAIAPIRNSYETNFLSGYPNRQFAPLQNIPRVEVIVAIASGLNHYFPRNPTDFILNNTFDDAANIPRYAHDIIAAATEQDLIVNFPNTRQLNPRQLATRGEIAALLCRALGDSTLLPPQYIVRSPTPPIPNFLPPPPSSPPP